MPYYDTFLAMNPAPKTRWRTDLQELVNATMTNASTIQESVEEEVAFGTLQFQPIEVRVNRVVDAKTGQRINDDFRKLIFRNIDYMPPVGMRYRFDNNIWMVYSASNIMTDTSSVYVRRCNNVLGIEDNFGNVYYEPCYIDYKVTETQIFRDYSMEVPAGRIQLTAQLNHNTSDINIDKRFIFGEDPYKIRERAKYDERTTNEIDTRYMVSFYADLDALAKSDNVKLRIADYVDYNFIINVPDTITGSSGDMGSISAYVTSNNTVMDYGVSWESSNTEIAEIDNFGGYSLISNGECEFTCTLLGNTNYKSVVAVTVTDTPAPSQEIVVFPNITSIRLNQSVTYEVYEYVDGEKTTKTFTYTTSGAPSNCYQFVGSENKFAVANVKQSSDNLIIDIKDDTDTVVKTLTIRLGGIV